MSKKDKNRLTDVQYWKWRCAVEELQHAKTRADLGVAQLQLMERGIEVDRLKAAFFKNKVVTIQEQAKLARESYDQVKAGLEKETGLSLTNTVIDDVTFEIKRLDGSDEADSE